MPARRAGRMRSPQPAESSGSGRDVLGCAARPGPAAAWGAERSLAERGGRSGRCRRHWRARAGSRLFTGARATCGPARAGGRRRPLAARGRHLPRAARATCRALPGAVPGCPQGMGSSRPGPAGRSRPGPAGLQRAALRRE